MATTVNDLVLVHIDSKPGFYARIEDISPDVKPGWWKVKLLVLTMPFEIYTWILEEAQINGNSFTMGGTPVMMEKVVSPVTQPENPTPPPSVVESAKSAKVVSLLDRKKGK